MTIAGYHGTLPDAQAKIQQDAVNLQIICDRFTINATVVNHPGLQAGVVDSYYFFELRA